MMAEVSLGLASGLIALAGLFVQALIPATVALILVSMMPEDASAVTWSVVARAVGSSLWPSILRSDSAASRGVPKPIDFLVTLVTFALTLVVIAGFVTPIGLYDIVAPGGNASVQFQYIEDLSPMGLGTLPRTTLGFTQYCGLLRPMSCPTWKFQQNTFGIDYSVPPIGKHGYSTLISPEAEEIFSSGAKQPTISSVFDIQWRKYRVARDKRVNNGSYFLRGLYRESQTLLLHDTIEPVEGLIVDTKDGGIGFRNHTVPKGLQHGATWSEDLLFIQPVTQCVDTNLTLDFTYDTLHHLSPIQDLVLTDRGGFVNLHNHYPFLNLTDTQANPNLYERAHKAAWLNNVMTMYYFNLTNSTGNSSDLFLYINSHIGKAFRIGSPLQIVDLGEFVTNQRFGNYINDYLPEKERPANPFNITSHNFTDIGPICSGAGGMDIASIKAIAAKCGLVYGVAKRSDGDSSNIIEERGNWSIPMYSCISAARATIKTVYFEFQGTELPDLKVVKLEDKSYPGKTPKPLWAVEESGMTHVEMAPIWGLVADKYEILPSIRTTRKESLWLPGYPPLGAVDGAENLAGIRFSDSALNAAYQIALGSSHAQDYSGRRNGRMLAKWEELSRTTNGTAKILNLVWTDLSANSVVGTKSVLGSTRPSQDPESQKDTMITVRKFTRQVRCEILYTIPAILLLVITIILVFVASVLWISRYFSLQLMRKRLIEISPGRIVSMYTYVGRCEPYASTNNWIESIGTDPVRPLHVRGQRDSIPEAPDPREENAESDPRNIIPHLSSITETPAVRENIELEILGTNRTENEQPADTCVADALSISQGSGQPTDTTEAFSVETTEGSGQVAM